MSLPPQSISHLHYWITQDGAMHCTSSDTPPTPDARPCLGQRVTATEWPTLIAVAKHHHSKRGWPFGESRGWFARRILRKTPDWINLPDMQGRIIGQAPSEHT